MSSTICTMPICQTSAGCVCGRTTYTPPFSPTVADTYWANEVKTLNEQIDRLTRELAEAERKLGEDITKAMHAEARATLRERSYQYARNDALEEAAKVAAKCFIDAAKNEGRDFQLGAHASRSAISAAIRALKEKP